MSVLGLGINYHVEYKFLSNRSRLLPVATYYFLQYLLMLSGFTGTYKYIVLLNNVKFKIIVN